MTFYRWKKPTLIFAPSPEEIRDMRSGSLLNRLTETIIVNKDMAMVRFYLQSRSAKYTPKLQAECPTRLWTCQIISLDDED